MIDHCEACPFASCSGCLHQSPETTCSVDGCSKARNGKNAMCSMHISRKHRHGDVDQDRSATDRAKSEAAFWAQVDKTETCWLWMGTITATGYGYFRASFFPGSGAHRFAWLFSNRPEIPEGMQLDHLCRVRYCVNPDHLEIVTPQENVLRGETLPAANSQKSECPKCGGAYSVAKRGDRKPGRYCQPCHSERRRQRKREEREGCKYQSPEGEK